MEFFRRVGEAASRTITRAMGPVGLVVGMANGGCENVSEGKNNAPTTESVPLDPEGDTQGVVDSAKDCPTCTEVNQDGDDFDVNGNPADCDDNNAEIYPGATEVCDENPSTQKDYNCDGIPGTVMVFKDADGDGFGGETSPQEVMCPLGPGYATNNEDCDDVDATINPAATDTVGDGVDGDCDGTAN